MKYEPKKSTLYKTKNESLRDWFLAQVEQERQYSRYGLGSLAACQVEHPESGKDCKGARGRKC